MTDVTTQPWLRRAARRTLLIRVRGTAPRGTEWGEAMLAEFEETSGRWEAIRWTLSSLRAARRLAPLPRTVRWQRRIVLAGSVLFAMMIPAGAFAGGVEYVPSGSMAPTLQIDDYVIVDHVAFRLTGLDRGDIVTLDAGGERWTKRIIGLPGDTIECRDGVVVVNGAVLAEPYLAAGSRTECDRVTVPDGMLYLMGDNRWNSSDSRRMGPIAETSVTGRVVAVL
jgi:signal peptidase I